MLVFRVCTITNALAEVWEGSKALGLRRMGEQSMQVPHLSLGSCAAESCCGSSSRKHQDSVRIGSADAHRVDTIRADNRGCCPSGWNRGLNLPKNCIWGRIAMCSALCMRYQHDVSGNARALHG